MVEIIGIIASITVAVSFFMNGETHIRAINIIGSAIFGVYGILIGSISIILLNAVSIIVNIMKIYKINKEDNSK